MGAIDLNSHYREALDVDIKANHPMAPAGRTKAEENA